LEQRRFRRLESKTREENILTVRRGMTYHGQPDDSGALMIGGNHDWRRANACRFLHQYR
jgi:hypothetical protein